MLKVSYVRPVSLSYFFNKQLKSWWTRLILD